MFVLSRVLSGALQPLVWVAVLLLLALYWVPRRPHAARRALVGGLAILFFIGWLPLPDALLRRLEDGFVPPQGTLEPFVGLVVLGGAIAPADQWRHGFRAALNDAGERVTASAALMREYPHLRMVYAGREDTLMSSAGDASSAPRALLTWLGVGRARILYEPASRNTYENAIFSAQLVGSDKARPWLLVTSAWHMPRAMAVFRAAGWNVVPYPVDYLTGSRTPWHDYSLAKGALRWQTLLHEYLGQFAYWVSGRTRP